MYVHHEVDLRRLYSMHINYIYYTYEYTHKHKYLYLYLHLVARLKRNVQRAPAVQAFSRSTCDVSALPYRPVLYSRSIISCQPRLSIVSAAEILNTPSHKLVHVLASVELHSITTCVNLGVHHAVAIACQQPCSLAPPSSALNHW